MGWWGKNNVFNGDGPSDILSDSIDQVLRILGISVPKPGSSEKVNGLSLAEMRDIFIDKKLPVRFHALQAEAVSIVDTAWSQIDKEYEEEFDRPSTSAEREEICQFVLMPMFLAL